MASHPVFWQI